MTAVQGWGPWTLHRHWSGWQLETSRFVIKLRETRQPYERATWLAAIGSRAGFDGPTYRGLERAFADLVGERTRTIRQDLLFQRAQKFSRLYGPVKDHSLTA